MTSTVPDARPARPTIAEMREVCQPPTVMDRRNAEHWAGRTYVRHLSIHLTRALISAPVSPNQITVVMGVVGVASGLALLIPGVLGAVLPFVLINVYLTLDCSDGELARWRRQYSNAGVYLDRVSHYTAEAAILVCAGFRAAQLHAGLWSTLGCLAAVGALIVKAETDLVDVSRYHAGLPRSTDAALEPRVGSVALLRRAASLLKVHRITGATEATMVLGVAGIIDLFLPAAQALGATRVAVVALVAVALTMSVAHLVSVVSSSRLS